MQQTTLLPQLVRRRGMRAARADKPNWPTLPYTLHAAYQAINEFGEDTFPTIDPVRMRGVRIDCADQLLDPTPGADPSMGGQRQVYFHAADTGDFGGTACWMGQNSGKIMGNHPAGSYIDAKWLSELFRLEHDFATRHTFQPGDLVEVRARAPGLFYAGKTNVNERHQKHPAFDFDIVLIEADYGLAPTPIQLADAKDAGNEFLFDPSRLSGAEHFQGALAALDDVSFVSTANWGPNAHLTIQDGTGRGLRVLLGRGVGFTLCLPPTSLVDLVGIFDQEAPAGGPYTEGYHLWIPNSTGYIRPHEVVRPGDLNCDGRVVFDDVNPYVLALTGGQTAYYTEFPCCLRDNAECNEDGTVDFADVDPRVALRGVS